jgi:hypothetical protein
MAKVCFSLIADTVAGEPTEQFSAYAAAEKGKMRCS